LRRSVTSCVRQRLPGDLEQSQVERFVAGEERERLPRLLLQPLVQRAQFGQLRLGGVARDFTGGVGLEQAEQMEHLRGVVGPTSRPT
jgi:hypothetical protein